ncbi:hypothetical protein LPTSP3_g16840 [Leptospira kobayashii]|uniref:Late embryogenesis abundant protein LEA-2 subgroup domain-containing protein n=1 Tax=Leptospira kobayashii TaxID=1917830 RepID=A0ABN6KCR7_9LEPT|nr:LEA type 2 family protein [Leptospira kobayashii]BDA78754.1 hypothetical protein LPTSP3_g16840 [Leptospira kobayashii]
MKQLIVCIFTFTIVNCSVLGVLKDKVPKPEFSFESLNIKEITLTDITLNMVTSVENPYPLSLPKSLLEMDLNIEGTKLSHISTDLGAIESKKTKDLSFEIKIKYEDIVKLYQKIPGKALLTVGIDGNLKVPLPSSLAMVGQDSISFPFQKQREIPAVLPSVDIKNFKILIPTKDQITSSANTSTVANTAISFLDGLLSGKSKTQAAQSAASAGLSNLDLKLNTEFDLNFQNKAASELLFQDLNYDLKLGGEKFLNGTPKEIINNGKESIVKVNTAFPVNTISSGLYKTIQSKTAGFDLNGGSGLQVPGLGETMKFNYAKNGKFSW